MAMPTGRKIATVRMPSMLDCSYDENHVGKEEQDPYSERDGVLLRDYTLGPFQDIAEARTFSRDIIDSSVDDSLVELTAGFRVLNDVSRYDVAKRVPESFLDVSIEPVRHSHGSVDEDLVVD